MPGEKTEKATGHKRGEERKQGNIVLSQDIIGAAVMLSIFGFLKAMGPTFVKEITDGYIKFLGGIGDTITGLADLKQKFISVVVISSEVTVPIFTVIILVSIIATEAQTRLLYVPPKFKFSSLNPVGGIKNLFSPKAFVETFKSILKIIIIGCIIFFDIKASIPQLFALYNASIGTSITWTTNIVFDICFKASEAFFIVGVADYFFQWWDYERRIKMSKEDIKEEVKNLEGNPQIKGRIKSEQMKMSRRRMLQSVPSADVVIRNPTHYAIALKYDRKKANAPIVVAKGQNNIALKIVEIAMASKVHIVENRPLAQALYKTVEIGDEIPEEFYKAVAEILAYIYRLKRAGRA